VDNKEIEATLHRIGWVLELVGENPYRIRAYHNAGRIIGSMKDEAEPLIISGGIQNIKGIGPSITTKMQDLVENGESAYLRKIKGNLPETFFEILKIPGVGPKRLKAFWHDLSIGSVKELEAACKDGRVASLPRFSTKIQKNILAEISRLGDTARRLPREEVLPAATAFGLYLLKKPGFIKVKIAGSLRRGKSTVKDVDLLASSKTPHRMMKAVISYPEVNDVLASGKTKTSVRLKSNLQVDVRIVDPEHFACALAYFTGSKDFNVALRKLALDRGYSLNEYQLRPLDGSNPPPITSEKHLHRMLGLNYIPPSKRETASEIYAQI
jgi:DNA polymerase (family 10)